MSEDRQTPTTRTVPINLGLFPPIGTAQVTPTHALAPGAQPLPSLMIAQPQDSLFPTETGQQYLSQGPTGPIPVSQVIDPSLAFMPGTGAHAALQQNLQRAQDVALSFGPGQFRAYHGTGAPPFEQFLDQFIGTGEGAQAYSWGHYVAQKPGTAKTYMPGEEEGQLSLGGQPWNWVGHPTTIGKDIAHDILMDFGGDPSKAALQIQGHILDMNNLLKRQPEFVNKRDTLESIDEHQSALDFLLKNQDDISYEPDRKGGLLNVWVKPNHEEFLDWDLPLHQQEQGVQDKLQSITTDPRIVGRDIYSRLVDPEFQRLKTARPDLTYSDMHDEAARLASKRLDSLGIPGMRFLDQQSRSLTAPATYSGEMTPLQQRGLALINNAAQPARWESGTAANYHSNLISNFENSSRARAAGNQYTLPTVDQDLEALRSLDPSKLVDPMRTYNYVVYDPKNIEITHRDGQRVHTLEPVDHDPWAEQKAVP